LARRCASSDKKDQTTTPLTGPVPAVAQRKKPAVLAEVAGESNSRRVGGDKDIVPVYNSTVFFQVRMTDISVTYNIAKGKSPQHNVLWAFTCLLPSSLGLDFYTARRFSINFPVLSSGSAILLTPTCN
jgi:hypothetical protein